MENKIVSEEKAKSELRNCFRRYLDNYYYFSKWYKENANTYYFIFKKNLKVTNIQYAELISLIKRYSKSNFENEKDDVKFGNKLQFLTVQQFNNAIAEIVSSFDKKLREFTNWENKLSSIIIRDEFNPNDKKIIQECSDTLLHLQNVERDYKIIGHKCIKKITDEKEKEKVSIAEHLTEVYYDMIRHVVIVDAFHGSCVLFINPTIHIPIDIVCAYSGYISDCGKALFIRDVDKAKKEDLKDDLKTFMEGYKKTSKKKEINFCVFSHEEFTNEKSSLTKELHGKEGLKIYFEKLIAAT